MSMGPFVDDFAKHLTLIFKHTIYFRDPSASYQQIAHSNYHMSLEILRLLIQLCARPGLQHQLPETKRPNVYEHVEPLWSLWMAVSRNVECCSACRAPASRTTRTSRRSGWCAT